MGMSRYVKAVARAQLATGFGIIVFWVLFFTVGLAPLNPPVCYFAFEHAFPLPDAVLAIGLLGGGALAIAGRPEGGHAISGVRRWTTLSRPVGRQLQFAEWHLYERPD
jgi:hypothetical protein